MSTIEMRSEVAGWLEELDGDFLPAVHTIVGNYVSKQKEADAVIGYDMYGQPKYASKMKALYDAEVRATLEDDDYMTIDEFEKESEQW